jgi:hypothetical protein
VDGAWWLDKKPGEVKSALKRLVTWLHTGQLDAQESNTHSLYYFRSEIRYPASQNAALRAFCGILPDGTRAKKKDRDLLACEAYDLLQDQWKDCGIYDSGASEDLLDCMSANHKAEYWGHNLLLKYL